MSMLRFVLRKISVIHNSLIKFWSVRKSNEGASLTQSIAKTKAKLQLDEAGGILSRFVWIILLCYLILGIVAFLLLYLLVGAPILVAIAVPISPAVITIIVRYKMRWEYFVSINFYLNGVQGEVAFNHRNTNQAKNSEVVQEIADYCNNHPHITLNCNNSTLDIVKEICKEIEKNTKIYSSRCFERNDFIMVKFDNTISIFCDV